MNSTSRSPKLFVSLPMRGIEDNIVRYKMTTLCDLVSCFYDEKYELIDTMIPGDPPKGNRLWYLGRSIQMLGDADLVIFSRDWLRAKGCLIEYMICGQYEIPHIFEIDILSKLCNDFPDIYEETMRRR